MRQRLMAAAPNLVVIHHPFPARLCRRPRIGRLVPAIRLPDDAEQGGGERWAGIGREGSPDGGTGFLLPEWGRGVLHPARRRIALRIWGGERASGASNAHLTPTERRERCHSAGARRDRRSGRACALSFRGDPCWP